MSLQFNGNVEQFVESYSVVCQELIKSSVSCSSLYCITLVSYISDKYLTLHSLVIVLETVQAKGRCGT